MCTVLFFVCLFVFFFFAQIKVEDVFGFWDNFKTTAALVEACRNKFYPPRFLIEVRVSSKRAIEDTCIEVLFKGAADELKTEILLECPTRCELILFHFSNNYICNLYTVCIHSNSTCRCRFSYTGKFQQCTQSLLVLMLSLLLQSVHSCIFLLDPRTLIQLVNSATVCLTLTYCYHQSLSHYYHYRDPFRL